MRQATLLGEHHTRLGALAAVAEGDAAITICRGGAAKTYSYTDPNEDAALFVIGEHGVLLAVADGHDGHQGSAAALTTLAGARAASWCAAAAPIDAARWRTESTRAVVEANHEVLAEAGRRGAPPAPTTFAFALWRRHEGSVHGAAVGDSHVFFAASDAARDIAGGLSRDAKRGAFLGRGELSEAEAEAWTAVETTPAGELRAIVLATDGISERGIGVEDPEAEVHRACDHAWPADHEVRPLAVAKAVTAVALGAQRRQRAGDNIACAVVLIDA